MVLVEPSDGKLVLLAQHVVLPTRMAKFGHAIRPPCAKEAPYPEASSCLDLGFTPDMRMFQQVVVLLHRSWSN